MAIFKPTTYNWQQKTGVALVLVLLLIVVMLHNPFFGYRSGRSFLDWYSIGAITVYLGPIKAALGFAGAIVCFGVAWVWLFEGPLGQPKRIGAEQPSDNE